MYASGRANIVAGVCADDAPGRHSDGRAKFARHLYVFWKIPCMSVWNHGIHTTDAKTALSGEGLHDNASKMKTTTGTRQDIPNTMPRKQERPCMCNANSVHGGLQDKCKEQHADWDSRKHWLQNKQTTAMRNASGTDSTQCPTSQIFSHWSAT